MVLLLAVLYNGSFVAYQKAVNNIMAELTWNKIFLFQQPVAARNSCGCYLPLKLTTCADSGLHGRLNTQSHSNLYMLFMVCAEVHCQTAALES